MPDDSAASPGSPAAIDMRSHAFRDDPHPLMRSLREAGRVSRDVVGVWLLCHHADVSSGLRSSHLSREPWRSAVYRQLRPFVADSTLERTAEQWMLFNDPPKHTRLRRLVNGAFKPPVIAALRERILAVADELLDALPAEGPFDLMASFAQQLPVRVICDVLGLPAQDFAKTKLWSDALAMIVEPVVGGGPRPAAGCGASCARPLRAPPTRWSSTCAATSQRAARSRRRTTCSGCWCRRRAARARSARTSCWAT
jgi:cytochrome P450